MNKFYNEILFKLKPEIKELEIETDFPIQHIESVIPIILQCLSELKEYVLKYGFENMEEEINFFKYQKPVIVANGFITVSKRL